MSPRKFAVPFKGTILFLIFFASPLVPLSIGAGEDQAQIYFLHGLKAKEEGNFLAAENLLRKAIEIEPNNADYRFELANLYAEQENLIEARFEYEQAVMIAPDHLASRYNLGLVYSELGLPSEAREEFRKVLDLDPSNIRAQIQIGYTYADQGFYDEAREAFQLAQEMDFTNPEPREALERVAQVEEEARFRSRSSLRNSLLQNERQLDQLGNPYFQSPIGSPYPRQPTQVSSRDALLQTGVLLVQQLLAKKSKTESSGQ